MDGVVYVTLGNKWLSLDPRRLASRPTTYEIVFSSANFSFSSFIVASRVSMAFGRATSIPTSASF